MPYTRFSRFLTLLLITLPLFVDVHNYAQQLADALQNTVIAPNARAQFNQNGETGLNPADKGGKWIPFTPHR